MQIATVTAASGRDCHGSFTFRNNTKVIFGVGGYLLEIRHEATANTTATWAPAFGLDNGTFLLPDLEEQLDTSVLQAGSKAAVSIGASMTVRTISLDTALYLLRAAIDVAPLPVSCIVPEEQLLLLALRTQTLLDLGTNRALAGDFRGAGDEYKQILPAFLDRSGDVAVEVGVDCAKDALKGVAKKAAIVGILIVNYVTWIPKLFFDYFRYGTSASASVVYTPTAPTTSTLIAYTGADGNIWVVTADGGESRRVTSEPPGRANFRDPRWSPDGTMLAFDEPPDALGRPGGIYLYSEATLKRLDTVKLCAHPTFLPDGRHLAFACNQQFDRPTSSIPAIDLRFNPSLGAVSTSSLDASDWKILIPYGPAGIDFISGDAPRVNRIDFSADDGAILLSMGFNEVQFVAIADSKGSDLKEISHVAYSQIPIVFDPTNGKDLIAAAYRCGPCPPDMGPELVRIDRGGSSTGTVGLRPLDDFPPSISVSSDGKKVVYASSLPQIDARDFTTIVVQSIPDGDTTAVAQGSLYYSHPTWQPVTARFTVPDGGVTGPPPDPGDPTTVASCPLADQLPVSLSGGFVNILCDPATQGYIVEIRHLWGSAAAQTTLFQIEGWFLRNGVDPRSVPIERRQICPGDITLAEPALVPSSACRL